MPIRTYLIDQDTKTTSPRFPAPAVDVDFLVNRITLSVGYALKLTRERENVG